MKSTLDILFSYNIIEYKYLKYIYSFNTTYFIKYQFYVLTATIEILSIIFNHFKVTAKTVIFIFFNNLND